MKQKEINVTCIGSRSVPREELEKLQGNLVELSQENFDKLRSLLIKYGFRFPIFVWNKKIIDGHQRLFVLNHLIENEGFIFNQDIPVCDIEAKDEREAKELLLIARSEYGDIRTGELELFILDSGIDFQLIKDSLELKTIKMADLFRAPVEIKEIEIKPFLKTHVLISFPPDVLSQLSPYLEKIKNTQGVEYEQSSN
jgi:hypothetical protein